MPASPFPDDRYRRRRGGGPGGLVVAVVAVLAVVVLAVLAVGTGVGPLGGGGDGDDDADAEGAQEPPEAAPDEALPLGELTETGSGPGRGVGCPAGAECTEFEVDCPDVPDPGVGSMAISPADGEPEGVIVFFSGGKGSNWWEDGVRPGTGEAHPFVTVLQREGYEVVQVRWDDGFSTNPSGEEIGFAKAACRSATAVDWVHDNRYAPLGLDPPTGACGFCVSGNSGGSSQSAWSLTHYGLAGEVDAAILTSGPPHTAIDDGCLHEGDPALWYDPGSARGFDEVYGPARGARGACTGADRAYAQIMGADSIDRGGTDYDYPNTRVVFILGTNDRTVAPEHARDLIERLESEGSPMVDVVDVRQMGHEITQSQTGLQALFQAVTQQG
ncbi:MAG TPA: hypothetical protein VGB14_01520 [Acidimicrobiales bacterium]